MSSNLILATETTIRSTDHRPCQRSLAGALFFSAGTGIGCDLDAVGCRDMQTLDMRVLFFTMGCESLGVEYLAAGLQRAGHRVALCHDPALFQDKLVF